MTIYRHPHPHPAKVRGSCVEVPSEEALASARRIQRLERHKKELMAKISALEPTVKNFSLIKYLPAGAHLLWIGEGHVVVNERTAKQIELIRIAIKARDQVPYFDFNHEQKAAAFYPIEFVWKDGAEGGVWAKGHWTSQGVACVWSGRYRYFSPAFYQDPSVYPPPIAVNVYAAPSMGGIVPWSRFGATMKLDLDQVR